MELEWLATKVAPDGAYPFELEETRAEGSDETSLVIDTRPLIRDVVRDAEQGVPAGLVSRRFHSGLVNLIALVCERLRLATGLAAVVLSGGVFMNVLLTREVTARLMSDGFRVYRHSRVPPNDGGLSLGQLAVAAAQAS
jgi:hydrogenase maturation protein HypF